MFVAIALVLVPLAVLTAFVAPFFLEPGCDDPTPQLVTSLRPSGRRD